MQDPANSPIKSFTLRANGPLWHVTDDVGDIGGVFTSLDAALRFIRRDCALLGTTRLVVIGEEPQRAA